MKYWILLVFRLLTGLDKRIERCDKVIERIALSPFGDTMAQYEEILSQMNKKNKLINLKVMSERIKSALATEDYFLLCKYASGVPVKELSLSFTVKKGALYKRLNKIFVIAERTLAKDGFTEEALEREYAEFPFIITQLVRLKRR